MSLLHIAAIFSKGDQQRGSRADTSLESDDAPQTHGFGWGGYNQILIGLDTSNRLGNFHAVAIDGHLHGCRKLSDGGHAGAALSVGVGG